MKMAASSKKRVCEERCGGDEKKFKSDEDQLQPFLEWCTAEGLKLNSKVVVEKDRSCAQYGMVASCDVAEGEVLFEIPRGMLLHPDNCGISQLISQEKSDLTSSSGWVPLLLALMYEYTNPSSRWRHYIHLVPDFSELDLPMFWSSEELSAELEVTGISAAVKRDLTNLTAEFNDIVLPFVRKHSDVFISESCQDLEFYKKMVAFIMAYSFTDEQKSQERENSDEESDSEDDEVCNPPMMVPMADILNHVSANNAQLFFGKESLKMVAKKSIKQGEEVFNTYGCISNSSLLHMYGFAERYPDNLFDIVEIPVKTVLDAYKVDQSVDQLKLLEIKLKFLAQQGVAEDDKLILGSEGFVSEEEAVHTLKVLTMSEEEFKILEENEGWDEESEDHENTQDSLTFDQLKKCPASWKRILNVSAKAVIGSYKMSIEAEETHQASKVLTKRQMFASYVRHGQMKLLLRLAEICSD